MGKSKSFLKKTCRFTTTALKKAQNLVEMSQINLKIAGLKCKAERRCAAIGALMVLKRNGGNKKLSPQQCDEKIESFCEDVEKLKQKIKKAKHEADEIRKHMNNCSFCDECEENLHKVCELDDDDDDCDEKFDEVSKTNEETYDENYSNATDD